MHAYATPVRTLLEAGADVEVMDNKNEFEWVATITSVELSQHVSTHQFE
jgi:hypothetical protein